MVALAVEVLVLAWRVGEHAWDWLGSGLIGPWGSAGIAVRPRWHCVVMHQDVDDLLPQGERSMSSSGLVFTGNG
jgi:hypothetical protein